MFPRSISKLTATRRSPNLYLCLGKTLPRSWHPTGIHVRSVVNVNLNSPAPLPRISQVKDNRDQSTSILVPPLAFVFDIDGVLIRGRKVLPCARRALNMLAGDNPWGIQIPFILLTNGGGVSEEVRSAKLSNQFGFEIKPSQYIQAHTILKTLSHKHADSPVLVLGGKNDVIRKVAENYGFKRAYTTLDVLAWNPSVWPFHDLTFYESASIKQTNFEQTPISAIFVFHDPRNWSLDIQIISDVILSGGIIGGPRVFPEEHNGRPPIELVFCNPDLLWRSDFDRPRLGQGAFKDAFQAVFKALTGSGYPYVQYGKPTEATYKFAENVLLDRIEEQFGQRYLPEVYMVGDNPESDIAGANAAKWSSVLVHTGVYEPEFGPPTYLPTHETEDVESAVQWAIEREVMKNSAAAGS